MTTIAAPQGKFIYVNHRLHLLSRPMRNQDDRQASEFLNQIDCRVAETRAGQIIDLGSKPKKIRDSG
jgi:hypothetical protein